MSREDSMSSFEHVELESDRNSPASASPLASAQPAAEPAAEEVAAEAADTSTTAAAPPSLQAASKAPPAAGAAAAADSTPTAQAAATLQSMLGFLGGGTAAVDKEQWNEVDKAGAEVVDDEPDAQLEDPVAEFEKEAMDAAIKAEEAMKEVGQKLLHGAAEAKESLSSLAHGLASWWTTLDPGSDGPSVTVAGGAGTTGGQRAQDVQQAAEVLGLEGGETVLESFTCQLLQTYTCSSNFFTPMRQVPFPGSLHITSQRLCFVFEEKGMAPIKLPGEAIKAVAKQAAHEQKGMPERLELLLEQAGQTLVLAHFTLEDMDSALALVEHLAEEEP